MWASCHGIFKSPGSPARTPALQTILNALIKQAVHAVEARIELLLRGSCVVSIGLVDDNHCLLK